MAHSQLEWDEYSEAWNDYGASDFVRALKREFGLSDAAVDLLSECDNEELREFYESQITSGEYYISEGSGVSVNIRSVVHHCTRESLGQFLRGLRQ